MEKMITADADMPICSVADNDVSPSITASTPAAVFTFVEVHPFSKAINDNSTITDSNDSINSNDDDDDDVDGLFLDQTVSTETQQKIAMNKFLAAQLSSNTTAKEDAWRELVQLMKKRVGGGDARSMSSDVSGGSRNNRRPLKNIGRPPRRTSGNCLGIGGRIKGGGNKDDVLGTICISSSAMKNIGSTHSSLTANTTDSDYHLDVSPKDTTAEGGGKEREGEKTTPPTQLPILSTSGVKVEQSPMVSPLSLGGSFDDDDVLIRPVNIMIGEQHYHPLANAPLTNKAQSQSPIPPTVATLVSPPVLQRRDKSVITSSKEGTKKSMSSMKKKRNQNIFFDIRKPFSDNYSLRSNDAIINNFVTPSLADSISEDNTSERHSTSVVSLSRIGLDAAAFTTSRQTETGTDSYTTTLNSNNCSDIDDGAVMLSTDAAKYYFTALLGDKKPKEEVVLSQQHPTTQLKPLDKTSRSASFVAQYGEVVSFEHMVNDSSTKKETIGEVVRQQQQSIPIDLDNLVSTSSDQHRSQKRRTKHRRGGNNNNNSLPSLEDQIRNVLQNQQTVVIRDDEEGGIEDEVVREGSWGLEKPKKNDSRVVRSGTTGSTTSAHDILKELRNSTTRNDATRSTTPPCSFISGSLNAPPLGIISIGGGRSPKKLPINSVDQAPSHHIAQLPALAPSRLDIPRPNRMFRKCISEPHPKTSAAATGMFSVETVDNMSDNSVSQREVSPLLSTTGADDVIKQDNPFERYRKAIGMIQQDSAPVKFNRPRGMFPKTYPQPSSAPEEELNNTYPFCNPPRTNLRDVEFPFEEQSSPISFTPDDASAVPHDVTVSLEGTSGMCISDASENAVASQMSVNFPTPSSITSQDLTPITLLLAPSKRDTRRANVVLPITVNESKLIRSTISRSNIADADDGVSLPAEAVEISNDSPVQRSWNVMDEIMNGTFLEDDAVEEAVWAATHSFSTTSIMDGIQNEEEEQSVFVVKRPEHLEWESKWTAFIASSVDDDDINTNEWADDDQWEDCNKDKRWEREDSGENSLPQKVML